MPKSARLIGLLLPGSGFQAGRGSELVIQSALWFSLLGGVGCGDKGEAASCSPEDLASLQETCLSYGGSFEAESSASDVQDCDAGGGLVGAEGGCRLGGEGDCAVICTLPSLDSGAGDGTTGDSGAGDDSTGDGGAGDDSSGDGGAEDSGAGDSGAGDSGDDDPTPGVDVELISLEPFEMGCTAGQGDDCGSDEEPAHEVVLTHSFWMDRTEVTQGEFARLMEGARPSYDSDCGDDCPVDYVTWYMAAAYANARSVEDGLEPYYDCEGEGEEVACAPVGSPYAAVGWRLPTEAEWEGAARCGTDLKYAGSDDLDAVGWYSDNTDGANQVGLLDANACGLQDMSGNVWEWVGDWDGTYDDGLQEDPQGPSAGTERLCRGGSWGSPAVRERVSSRCRDVPHFRNEYLGLRLVRTIP